MSRLLVAPIVEGHGEYASIRELLRRVWCEVCGGEHVEVLRPIREKRHRLAADKNGALSRAVQFAARSLRAEKRFADWPSLVLVLLDADNDLPCQLGPALLSTARAAQSDIDVSVVIANVEYETWFVAAAESLGEMIRLRENETVPENPEALRCGKGWIKQRAIGLGYSETLHQPRLTAKFDLALCRRRSPSFDKLCRELERRCVPTSQPSADQRNA